MGQRKLKIILFSMESNGLISETRRLQTFLMSLDLQMFPILINSMKMNPFIQKNLVEKPESIVKMRILQATHIKEKLTKKAQIQKMLQKSQKKLIKAKEFPWRLSQCNQRPLKSEVICKFLHRKIYTELTKIKLNLRTSLNYQKLINLDISPMLMK